MTKPLEGLKVVDFSEHYFVPASAAVLGEWGADVIKVERRDGDHLRHLRLGAGDGYDFLFQLCNRNKRDIALDVETPAGREILHQLVAQSDVFMTNHLPRVQRRLGTSPADIFAINPKIVYARGSGQGQRGPDAEVGGNDGVSFWSRAGVAFMLTQADAPDPVAQRPAIGDGPTGIALAAGVLAAVIQAGRTGKGVEVNTSLLNSGMWTLGPDIAYASLMKENPGRSTGARVGGPLGSPYLTSDGRLISFSMTNEPRYWPRACRALGLDDLIDSYPDQEERFAKATELQRMFAEVVGSLTAEEVERRMQSQECVYAFINSPVDVLTDRQALANGYLLSHPDKPEMRLPAAPAQFDDEVPEMTRLGPALGEHSEEILSELGYSEERIHELTVEGTIGVVWPTARILGPTGTPTP
jgi:crotonobetainyl-CoA:carnitine CoA-transferase CaiB-like acyl-CoA transferase